MGRAVYAYADGDPISKKDPLGLDPWGGLNGGVTPEEAEAQAVEQWVNNLWNTPDPCVKAYFEQHYGPGWTRFIGFFSAYSLMSGPQNVAPGGPEGAWREVGESIAIKGPAGAVANRVFPNAAPVAGKVLGWTGSIASVIASAWDVIGTIRALDAEDPSGQCGCKRQ